MAIACGKCGTWRKPVYHKDVEAVRKCHGLGPKQKEEVKNLKVVVPPAQ